jgi:hypothetical protein
MMRRAILLLCTTAALVACSQSADNAANSTANTVAPKEKRSAYCFFKDEETKGWKAAVDKTGNVTVTGRAHVKDARYKPELGQPKVTATSAEVSPTIAVNTGYASPDNWWDVSFAIPGSAAVESVTVSCGRKTMAELTVKRPPSP